MTTAAYVHGNPKILVVDDEEAARENLQRLLESSGFAPTVAADGQEALDRAAEIDFAIALMDIKMPRMSCLEALPKLRKLRPDIVIIMTTAVGDVDMAMDAVRLGAHDYVVKPLDFDTLIGRTKNALAQRELRIRDRQLQENLEFRVKDLVERSESNFAELVRALGREHRMLFATGETTKVGGQRILSDLPPELRHPISSTSEFREALLRILRRTEI